MYVCALRGLPHFICKEFFSQGQQRFFPMSGQQGSCTQILCYSLAVSHAPYGFLHRKRMLFFTALPSYAPDVPKSDTCCMLDPWEELFVARAVLVVPWRELEAKEGLAAERPNADVLLFLLSLYPCALQKTVRHQRQHLETA